jgi:predicted outer membrane repeat protein
LSGDGVAGWGQGAGVSCYLSSPTFSECVFYANWAGGQGGALCSYESSPTLKDCVFKGNEAGMQGGAIYGQDTTLVAIACTFHANWSWDGGAVYTEGGSSSRVTNCRFLGNAGHGSGGALFDAGRDLDVINSVFSGNLAYIDGGATALAGGPSLFTNCTFNRNVAQPKQSGQTLALYQTTTALTNCIVWNDDQDTPQEQILVAGAQDRPAELIVSYSDLLGGAELIIRKANANVTWGSRNINVDPKFQKAAGPDGVEGTPDDDLRLQSGSLCLDAGDNTAVPADADDLNANGNRQERIPFDLDDQARFTDAPAAPNTGRADGTAYPLIVDLGAYEL